MHVVVAFSVTPVGGASDSISDAVAQAVRVVRKSNLPNETNAMFTNVEGEWDQVMAVVKEAALAVAAKHKRVNLEFKADLRQGPVEPMKARVESVESHLVG